MHIPWTTEADSAAWVLGLQKMILESDLLYMMTDLALSGLAVSGLAPVLLRLLGVTLVSGCLRPGLAFLVVPVLTGLLGLAQGAVV